MRQLTTSVFVETGLRGSNHGFVTTTDAIVLCDYLRGGGIYRRSREVGALGRPRPELTSPAAPR
jgi:hypothetical protein